MKISITTIVLLLLSLLARGQEKFDEAVPLDLNSPTSFAANINGYAEIGPAYDAPPWVTPSPPAPTWFYFENQNAGQYVIEISSNPNRDIDFTCWGPFSSPSSVNLNDLTQQKVVSSGYGPYAFEVCNIPVAQPGEYYFLMISNWSKQACTITLSPATPPSVNCPPDQVVNKDADCNAYLPDYTSLATIEDPDNLLLDETIAQVPAPNTPISTATEVTLKIGTEELITATCSFMVSVVDNTPPTITPNDPITLYANGDGKYEVPDFNDKLNITDNCDDNTALTIIQTPEVGLLDNSTTYIQANIKAIDISNNEAEVNIPLLYADTISPTITHPAIDTLYVDENCEYILEDFTISAAVNDNIDDNLTIIQIPANGEILSPGYQDVLLKVQDQAGNNRNLTLHLVVWDNTPPSIDPIPAQDIFADANNQYNIPDFSGMTNIIDNCDNDLTITQNPSVGLLSDITGISFATLSAKDDHENETAIIIPLNFQDITPPSITHPDLDTAYVDINCIYALEDFTNTAIVSDNAPGDVTVTQTPAASATMNPDNYSITLKATDQAGNESEITLPLVVWDNTSPTIAPILNHTVYIDENGKYPIPDFTTMTSINDNCDNDLAIIQNPPAGLIDDIGSYTYATLTAKDDYDNDSTIIIPFDIQDIIPPTITHPEVDTIYVDDNCEYTLEDFTLTAIVSDNASGVIDVQQIPLPNTVLNPGNYSILLKAQDAAANVSEITLSIVVWDGTPPKIDPIGTYIVYTNENGQYDIPDFSSMTSISDNCDNDLTIVQDPPSGLINDLSEYSAVSLGATDDHENKTVILIPLDIRDTIPPSITHQDIDTLYVDAYCEHILGDYTQTAIVDDNVPGEINVLQNPLPNTMLSLGNHQLKLTAQDLAGNESEIILPIIVIDSTAPDIDPIPPYTIFITEEGKYPIPDFKEMTNITDNCYAALTVTQIPPPGLLDEIIPYTFSTLSARDGSDNESTIIIPFIIEDIIPPTISHPTIDTLFVDLNCEHYLKDYTTSAIVSDNAPGDISINQIPPANTLLNPGDYVLKLIAQDAFGNTNEISIQLTVWDGTPPSITPIAGHTVFIDENGKYPIPDFTTMTTIVDNCDANLSIIQDPPTGLLDEIDPYTFATLIAKDNYGNDSIIIIPFDIQDIIPPSITHPEIDTLYVDDNCKYLLQDFTLTAVVSDNAPGEVDIQQNPPANTLLNPGNYSILLKAQDAAANVSELTLDIIVWDSISPSIDPIGTYTIYADENGQYNIPDFNTMTSITDNCDNNLVITQLPAAGLLDDISPYSFAILSAEDKAGNNTTIIIPFDIQDIIPPSISHPDVDTLFVDNNCENLLQDFTLSSIVSDNVPGDIDVQQLPPANTPLTPGNHDILLKAQDLAGNVTEFTLKIIVWDTISPAIVPIPPQHIFANEDGKYDIPDFTAMTNIADNCDADPFITQVPVSGLLDDITPYTYATLNAKDMYDNDSTIYIPFILMDTIAPVIVNCPTDTVDYVNQACLIRLYDYASKIIATDNITSNLIISQVPEPGSMLTVGIHSISIQVTDDANNSSYCRFTLEVIDTIPPTITPIDELNVYMENNGDAYIPDFTLYTTITDNCDPDITTEQYPLFGSIANHQIYPTGKLIATDIYGNKDSIVFPINYLDTIPPEIIMLPLDTLYLDEFCEAKVPDYTEFALLIDHGSPPYFTGQTPENGTVIQGTDNLLVQLDAADEAGNTSSKQFTVIVSDTTSPTIEPLATQNIYFDSEGNVYAPDFRPLVVVYDFCDSDPDLIQIPTPGILLEDYMNYPYFKIIAIDDSQNKDSIIFAVNYLDTIPPQIICPEEDIIYTDKDCLAYLPDYTESIIVDDNLGNVVSVTQEPEPDTPFFLGTKIVEITAIDDLGNVASCEFTVMISDSTPPIITPIPPQTLYFDENGLITLPNFIPWANIYDYCDENPIAVQTPPAGILPNYQDVPFVIIKATDHAMNSDSIIIPIIYMDTIAPQIVCTEIDPLYKDENCEVIIPDFTASISYSDNLDDIMEVIQIPEAGSIATGDPIEFKFIVTDSYNNSDSCFVSTSSLDTISPQFEEIPLVHTLYADENCSAILPAIEDILMFGDNCDDSPSLTQTPAAGTSLNYGQHQIQISITDASLNTTNSILNIMVADTTAPTIVQGLGNQEVMAMEDECFAFLEDYTSSIIAADNCDSELLIQQHPQEGTIITGSENIITLYISDQNLNTISFSFNVNVMDLQAPDIACKESMIIIEKGENCSMLIEDYSYNANYSDNCDPDPVITQNPAPGSIVFEDTIITLYISDASGNTNSCEFKVSGVDQSAPVFDCNENITSCDTIVFFDPPAVNDNCSDPVITQIDGPLSGSVFNIGKTIITYMAEDEAGNQSFCSFEINVEAKKTVTFVNFQDPTFCEQEGAIELPRAYPLGGIYSGKGVIEGNLFDPATAGTGTHTIYYTYETASGCMTYDYIQVSVNHCPGYLAGDNERLEVYPNPFQDKINIRMINSRMEQMMIMNYSGNMIMSQEMDHTNYTMDMKELTPGIYFIHVHCSSGNYFQKKIIKK